MSIIDSLFSARLNKDYNSKDLYLTWDGIPLLGLKDMFLDIQFETDHLKVMKGVDGNIAYTMLTPPMAVIQVSLEQGSLSNNFLFNVIKAQMDNNDLSISASFKVSDTDEGELFTGLNTVLLAPTKIDFGKTHSDSSRVWKFQCSSIKIPEYAPTPFEKVKDLLGVTGISLL